MQALNCATCDLVCRVVGCITLAYIGIRLLNWIRINFIAGCNVKAKYNKGGDNWAVVTGASDGIGKAIAVDLAKRGINVAILARTKSKLDEVAGLIEKRGVSAKVIPFDFAAAGDKEYNALFGELDGLKVSMLVNNVGINYEHPKAFDEESVDLDIRMLKVNCEAQVRMTKYVLPKMKSRRNGAIVNLSSTFSKAAAPRLSTYGGTKGFNAHFSDSLAVEVAEFGIDVLTVLPMMVCSQMSGRSRPSFDCPDARVMAAHTINKLGNVTVTEGHRHHCLIGSIVRNWVPTSYMNNFLLKTNKTAEKKAIKKKERLAAEAAKQ